MDARAAAAELRGLDDLQLPEWLAALEHPDALRREHRPAHVTASGLVVDRTGTATLLVLHRKVRRWMQPGGHVDAEDTSLAGAALREATEETGVPDLVVDPVPVALDRHAAPCGAEEHLDVQFVLRAVDGAAPVVSAESLDVRWWPLDALPAERVDLDALVRAVRERFAR